MSKLAKSTLPHGHSRDDFQCFGPPATKDGQFQGTMICDMGCFNQGDSDEAVDSNKYYHAAVAQSKKDQKWYTYFEYGRVGVSNPQFQFAEYSTKEQAVAGYEKQLHDKNDKRGEWHQHPVLGNILRPKKGKDCYLVRPQTTRSTGLPDARTITSAQPTTVAVKTTGKTLDSEASKLLSDLNVGTISYTRTSMVGNALPTKEAVDEGRLILSTAQTLVNKQSSAKTDKKELEDLTKLLYSRIPKVKHRTQTDWVLDASRIWEWQQELDAYESAILAYNSGTVTTVQHDLPYHIRHIKKEEALYKWVSEWWLAATRNVHAHLNKALKVLNLFEIDRKREDFVKYLNAKGKRQTNEEPLHQPKNKRPDIDEDIRRIYTDTKTWMLFHGTRSCNVSGIMREHFRMPKTLSGVHISGAAFGSGVYKADDIKKSIGYTSHSGGYWSGGAGGINGRGAFMFICDTMIGIPNLVRSSGAYQGPGTGYDSIFAKAGVTSVANNEFIIFDPQMSNLRYLVEFQ